MRARYVSDKPLSFAFDDEPRQTVRKGDTLSGAHARRALAVFGECFELVDDDEPKPQVEDGGLASDSPED